MQILQTDDYFSHDFHVFKLISKISHFWIPTKSFVSLDVIDQVSIQAKNI